MEEITCFKAYDVRGRIPDQLNEDVAYRIGRAFAEVIKPRQVVVGHDIRLTSEAIKGVIVMVTTAMIAMIDITSGEIASSERA